LIDFDITSAKNLKVHFVGIGGISMSGLAETLLHYGYNVSGSDARSSKIIDRLVQNGAKVSIGHEAKNVEGAGLVVYTAAVKQDNPELIRAKELGIKAQLASMGGLATPEFDKLVGDADEGMIYLIHHPVEN
jgi:UDP-N-acetylmuramate--alanine ligase